MANEVVNKSGCHKQRGLVFKLDIEKTSKNVS